jgi:hypothetical protein
MKDRGLHGRFAVLQLASLIGMSVCFARPAPSVGPPSGLQLRMSSVANTMTLPAFRAKSGAPPARPILDLSAPAIATSTDGHSPTSTREYVGTGSLNASAFRLSIEKPKSPAEAMVRRARREGLPIARLWENESALLSLGFNQKGQAGLWLIRKFP